MIKQLKKCLTLLLLLPALGACERVPVGSFGLASGEAGPVMINNGNGNTKEEIALQRLNAIDASINASLARLEAAMDPNSPPANLDKLVHNDEIDPALRNDPFLYRQALINQKFDEKNQALIDDQLSGNLSQLNENELPAGSESFDDRSLQQRDSIDQKLQEKMLDLKPDYTSGQDDKLTAQPNSSQDESDL